MRRSTGRDAFFLRDFVALGIPSRFVMHCYQGGTIRPSVYEGKKSGNHHVYSAEDVRKIAALWAARKRYLAIRRAIREGASAESIEKL